MNVPHAHECFTLADGEKKITFEKDNKVPNAYTFVLIKEDHTLGNLLRAQLVKDPHVIFSGYRMPHPMEYRMELRVQTDSANYSPVDALEQAIRDLVAECTHLGDGFK
eukprot:Ihof_evm1s1105 gene=Ihof_evmTU1s1105